MTASDSALGLSDFRAAAGLHKVSEDALAIARALTAQRALDAGTVAISITRATGAGTVAAGAISVRFKNGGGADATVNTVTLKTTEDLPLQAPNGYLLPAIPYVATGTELLITAVYPPA